MTVHSVEEFRKQFLKETGLHTGDTGNVRRYSNNHRDSYLFFQKDQCYEFGVADYTIPKDFAISFANPQKLFRFGVVYQGTTRFRLDEQGAGSFSPSAFMVIEENISGKQVWTKGQHFHGAEVTIYWDYFQKIFESYTGHPFGESRLLINHTYHYLPTEMIQCVSRMRTLAETGCLNAIYFEGMILECMAILYNEIYEKDARFFFQQEPGNHISIGNRKIHLNYSDIDCLRKAHDILTENRKDPPTIDALSSMVGMNSQKLKAGFAHQYHMTIGEYILSTRMSHAASLLCTTSMHVHDIALEVGYTYAESFIKAFRGYYHTTPLKYRKEHLS